jgi:alkyl hydroperoxide reductase subunit AhpC
MKDLNIMKRRYFSQTLLAGIVLASSPIAAHAVPEVNQPAPAFTAATASGKPVNLADYKGKTVVLEWTNHDCPFVVKHYESGNIPKLQKEAAAKGVVWLQVISSAPGQQGNVDGAGANKLNESRSAKPAGTILDADGKVGKLYGAQTTPHIFIIDPKGNLAYKGGIDSIASAKQQDIEKAEPYVANAIKAVVSGQKVAQPSTRPYGCSVKYAS